MISTELAPSETERVGAQLAEFREIRTVMRRLTMHVYDREA